MHNYIYSGHFLNMFSLKSEVARWSQREGSCWLWGNGSCRRWSCSRSQMGIFAGTCTKLFVSVHWTVKSGSHNPQLPSPLSPPQSLLRLDLLLRLADEICAVHHSPTETNVKWFVWTYQKSSMVWLPIILLSEKLINLVLTLVSGFQAAGKV